MHCTSATRVNWVLAKVAFGALLWVTCESVTRFLFLLLKHALEAIHACTAQAHAQQRACAAACTRRPHAQRAHALAREFLLAQTVTFAWIAWNRAPARTRSIVWASPSCAKTQSLRKPTVWMT